MWVRIPVLTLVSLEQDTLLELFLFTQGYNWVPARVEVDIVYDKAMGAWAVYFPGNWERLKGCYWPYDQDTNVKRIRIIVKMRYKNLLLILRFY